MMNLGSVIGVLSSKSEKSTKSRNSWELLITRLEQWNVLPWTRSVKHISTGFWILILLDSFCVNSIFTINTLINTSCCVDSHEFGNTVSESKLIPIKIILHYPKFTITQKFSIFYIQTCSRDSLYCLMLLAIDLDEILSNLLAL